MLSLLQKLEFFFSSNGCTLVPAGKPFCRSWTNRTVFEVRALKYAMFAIVENLVVAAGVGLGLNLIENGVGRVVDYAVAGIDLLLGDVVLAGKCGSGHCR